MRRVQAPRCGCRPTPPRCTRCRQTAHDGRVAVGGHLEGLNNEDRGALVEPADKVEQELAAGLGEGQIAEFIEDDEVHARQVVGQPPLASAAALGLEPVEEVDHVVEPAAGAGSDAASGDGDGKMRLPVPVPPTSTALRCWAMKPPPARSCTSVWLIGVASNWKRSHADVVVGTPYHGRCAGRQASARRHGDSVRRCAQGRQRRGNAVRPVTARGREGNSRRI